MHSLVCGDTGSFFQQCVRAGFSIQFPQGVPHTGRVHSCWGTPRNKQEGNHRKNGGIGKAGIAVHKCLMMSESDILLTSEYQFYWLCSSWLSLLLILFVNKYCFHVFLVCGFISALLSDVAQRFTLDEMMFFFLCSSKLCYNRFYKLEIALLYATLFVIQFKCRTTLQQDHDFPYI